MHIEILEKPRADRKPPTAVGRCPLQRDGRAAAGGSPRPHPAIDIDRVSRITCYSPARSHRAASRLRLLHHLYFHVDMYYGFDTATFISEIQKRPAIWDRSSTISDILRQQQWIEIVNIYSGDEVLSAAKKQKLRELFYIT